MIESKVRVLKRLDSPVVSQLDAEVERVNERLRACHFDWRAFFSGDYQRSM